MTRSETLLDAARAGRVLDVDIAERMEQAFLDYSMSVIVGRALPDARDGLKPVQRRILFAMWEAGLRPDRPHRKCASAVGDVMKKYHPHGDSSIYEALARMAQDFSTRVPLVDGHGNFGSVDGDAPAAMRYTEARLSPAAMELLAGIDEDTVDFAANYDGYEEEPLVLPARFPNLLVNGASGIAVGMATTIPPHNLRETIAAARHLIGHPDATVDDLMRFVPAPDFPTGARIVDTPGIRDAYLTGRGQITVEAIAATETRSGGLPRIVVTELPYQVNKAALLERMAKLVDEKKLDGIRDLRDESSKDGMRVVIELKRGQDPAGTLSRLYTLTDLRTTVHANMVALTATGPDGALMPRTIGLVEALTTYIGHQREVLTRRTQHRRDKAAARAHVLEGLLIALDHLDDVIALIRAADSADEARTQLIQRFEMTEVQATAVLDMQLRRLARLERDKLAAEHAELMAIIAGLDEILGDATKLDALLSEELAQIAATHGDDRRSRIDTTPEVPEGEVPGDATTSLEAQSVAVYVTAGGYLKSVPERRATAAHSTPRDPVVAVLRGRTDQTILAIDTDGGGYRVDLADVPVATMRQRGVTIAQLLGDGPQVPLAGAVLLDGDGADIVVVSAQGRIKRTAAVEYLGRTRAMIAAGLKDDDRLVAVVRVSDADHLFVAHTGGQVLRMELGDVRAMGRSAAGVAGLSVPGDAEVCAASVLPGGSDEGAEVLTVGADGTAKRAPAIDYPVKGRATKGVQSGAVPLAWCGVAGDLHVTLADEATVVRPTQLPEGRRSGRPATSIGSAVSRAVPESG